VSYITVLKQKTLKVDITQEHTEVKLMCCRVESITLMWGLIRNYKCFYQLRLSGYFVSKTWLLAPVSLTCTI